MHVECGNGEEFYTQQRDGDEEHRDIGVPYGSYHGRHDCHMERR